MGSIFIVIFDVNVLNAIYPMVYISRQYGIFLQFFPKISKNQTFVITLVHTFTPKTHLLKPIFSFLELFNVFYLNIFDFEMNS